MAKNIGVCLVFEQEALKAAKTMCCVFVYFLAGELWAARTHIVCICDGREALKPFVLVVV